MLALIGAIISSTILSIMCITNESPAPLKHCKWVLPLLLLISVLSIIIPTEKQMYTLAGGYYVANIEGIDKLPKNVVGAVNKFIETYTEDKSK